MADFNPIRDLRSPEADPFNVPAGQSTQEVEDMRLRLVLTREKTENIVKIIKRAKEKDIEIKFVPDYKLNKLTNNLKMQKKDNRNVEIIKLKKKRMK